jgi:hypothetical protein
LCNEGVERRGGEHLGRRHGEVERHHGRTVPLVERDAWDLVVLVRDSVFVVLCRTLVWRT